MILAGLYEAALSEVGFLPPNSQKALRAKPVYLGILDRAKTRHI